jgi:2'-5' RNA ligase
MASLSMPHFKFTSNQTALALIVPDHLLSEINSLRLLHDKAFRKWPPHINVLYPFVEPGHLSSAIDNLRKALQKHQFQGLEINITDKGTFKHRRNATVFLKPDEESETRICMLRSLLVEALGCQDRDGTHDGTFRPHITIGQTALIGTALERLLDQAGKIAAIKWEGFNLAVLKREASGEMKTVEELPLGESEEVSNISKQDSSHLIMDLDLITQLLSIPLRTTHGSIAFF